MNKVPEPKRYPTTKTATTPQIQELRETPKSTRFLNSKEQRESGDITDTEEYNTPLLLLPEGDEGTGTRIVRERRTRTQSITEYQPKGTNNKTHRKDIANTKRKLQSPEDREENKSRKITEEKADKRKAEEELLQNFNRSRRTTRSSTRETSVRKGEDTEDCKGEEEKENTQTENRKKRKK